MKKSFFERDSVKWVYFFPLALIATIFANLVYALLDFLFWSRTNISGSWISIISKELIRGVMTSYVFYSIIYDHAPKYKLWISISLAIILVLSIGMIIPTMGQGPDPEVLILFCLGMIFGAVFTIYNEEKNPKQE